MSSNTSNDDELIIVCQVYRTFADRVIPGTRMIRASCGHLAWLSPQGQAFLDEHPSTVTVCFHCPPKDVKAHYRVPGSRAAMLAEFGDDVHKLPSERSMVRHNIQEWPH